MFHLLQITTLLMTFLAYRTDFQVCQIGSVSCRWMSWPRKIWFPSLFFKRNSTSLYSHFAISPFSSSVLLRTSCYLSVHLLLEASLGCMYDIYVLETGDKIITRDCDSRNNLFVQLRKYDISNYHTKQFYIDFGRWKSWMQPNCMN